MATEPYSRFRSEDMILRDYLAADRTALANERTLLAYLRTALGLGGVAAAVIHFSESAATEFIGWMLIPIALGLLAVGVYRYLHFRRRIGRIGDQGVTGTV